MTPSLDQVFRIISDISEKGIGKNCGNPPSPLNLKEFKHVKFIDSDAANDSIMFNSFGDFLLALQLEKKYFSTIEEAKKFDEILDDISNTIRPYLNDIVSKVLISGLNNEPRGFSPSRPASTVGWIFGYFAQEFVAVQDFHYAGPLRATDLCKVLDLGRIPVGYQEEPFSGILKIY